ncbi:CGNR zinc finger domain-containing protein [Prauserella cavernicola]|uniref:CGNR zinc finger domain-containing protein n=1 Tax=Prauserella cavernicola TaxID=2800127 RepID=A0A934V308_9PSEU|nr:CGNR zinc finger domain-containing protein [Prauserella cavernicola]MBK1783069.1 CGNR zinc finger domain-containing protein [Prauserella cavernicola]
MEFNPYGGTAARVAAVVVNAIRESADDLVERLQAEDMRLTSLTAEQHGAVAGWAARLGEVFAEPDTGRRVDLVNTLLADSACRPHISRHDAKQPHIHYASEDDDWVRRIQAYTAGGIAHLLCDDPARMGVCGREGCEVVYVDTSRNGRRRFCSTRCATRVHVAQHRERQRV